MKTARVATVASLPVKCVVGRRQAVKCAAQAPKKQDGASETVLNASLLPCRPFASTTSIDL